MLASEYGWTKDYILEHVYLDELMRLMPQMRRRTITEYQMQLAISSNPHSKKPKALWDTFANQLREPVDEKIDKSGLEYLKQKMATGKAFVVK